MTEECIDPIELFKFEAYHEDPEVQMRAIKKLPTLAVALDVDRTRHELISCLEEFLDMMYFQNDEILSGLAEQLGKFSHFIGGAQYAHILFPMLDRLALTEDVITRDKAVESLQHIASLMDREHLNIYFVPLVHKLSTGKWCYSKCSAAGLFTICYPKISDNEKADLRNLFFRLLGDESPAVRRAAIGKMSEFIKVVDIEHLKNEFVPEFIKLADDEQDSVRLLNVYIAIAIAARFNTQEIETYILGTVKNMSADKSWRVRYQFANEINSIQAAVGPTITRKCIIPLYKDLVHDSETSIREISARKIVHFCEMLQKTYAQGEEPKDLDPLIKDEMFCLIKELDQDVEDVQDGLYSVITSLSYLLGEKNTKEFLLPLITSSLENGSPKVKENIIANLNNIICIVDISCLTDKVRQLISEMVDTTATYWRVRRNLIVTLSHIANHSKKEYFNEHLKPLYVKLLNDAVYGVRKVAPLILPVLMKNFGVAWAKESIIPTFMEFHDHTYYLFRMMCLFGIDELISPTLQITKITENHLLKVQYLRNFENCTNSTNAIHVLYKISFLNSFLQERLQNEWVKFLLECSEDDEYFQDDVKTYAEDTIGEFAKTGNFDILTVSNYEIENQSKEECYLEGVLYFCIAEFIPTIRKMAQDKVVNVCLRAVNTLKKIINFSNSLFEELSADNIIETLQRLPKEEVDSLKADIEAKLQEHIKSEDELIPSEKQNTNSCESDNSLDGETIIFSKEELSNIEQIIFNNIEGPVSADKELAEKQNAKPEEAPKSEETSSCDITSISAKNENESETNFMD